MLNQPKPVTSRLRIAVAGATAHLALLEDVAEGSHAYHLTGARNWTMPQIAEELSHLLGRRISYGMGVANFRRRNHQRKPRNRVVTNVGVVSSDIPTRFKVPN